MKELKDFSVGMSVGPAFEAEGTARVQTRSDPPEARVVRVESGDKGCWERRSVGSRGLLRESYDSSAFLLVKVSAVCVLSVSLVGTFCFS